MSEIILAWTLELRSMDCSPRTTGSGKLGIRLRIVAQPTMACRGLRSSWDSVARNSSFERLARSASARAARSLASKFSLASSFRNRCVTSVATRTRVADMFSRAISHSNSAVLPSFFLNRSCRLERPVSLAAVFTRSLSEKEADANENVSGWPTNSSCAYPVNAQYAGFTVV